MNARFRFAIAAAAAGLATPATAATTCLASATPVAFGIYNPSSSQDTAGAGVVTVTCSTGLTGGTADASFSIAMSAGAGSYVARTLLSGTNRLGYNIYTDAGMTAVWGDGTGGSSVVGDTIRANTLGVARTYTAYGRIPTAQTTIAAGIYTDTIIVTIAY